MSPLSFAETQGNHMSIDYQIFFQTDEPAQCTLDIVSSVDGITITSGLQIAGLVGVSIEELRAYSREIMHDEFGEYGLNVNWAIRGTYDKTTNIDELLERLLECAARIIHARPNHPLSVMREGESFYLFYDVRRTVISRVYSQSLSLVESLFGDSYEMKEMVY